MSKKEKKVQYHAISRRKHARAHKANWWEKQGKTKTYKEHGSTTGRKFWLCSHTDVHKREGKTYSMSTSPKTCALSLVSGSELCMGRRGRRGFLGMGKRRISLWPWSRVVLSSEWHTQGSCWHTDYASLALTKPHTMNAVLLSSQWRWRCWSVYIHVFISKDLGEAGRKLSPLSSLE